MDVERLKCKHCGKFPDGEIFECAAKEHIVCVGCAEKSKKILCACGAKLIVEKQRNPIEQLIQDAKTICRYEENGCTWKFTSFDMEAHVAECKFRPYRCVASTLNVLRCDWIGLQYEIENHLVQGHKELGPVFRFREFSSMVFKDHVSLGGLKLIDAFSKHFLFHFFSDAAKRKLFFMMVYFGRREESDLYCFELELRSLPWPDQTKPTAEDAGAAVEPTVGMVRSVKFVERCHSDSENLAEQLEEDHCIVLTHQQVKNYLHNGKIYFSYKVRKVDGSHGAAARDRKLSETEPALKTVPAGKAKPRPPPFVFAQKGKVATNTKRAASSITNSAAGSSKPTEKSSALTTSPARSDSSAVSSASPGSAVSRSPSSASTLTMSSERNIAIVSSGTFDRHSSSGPLSSINRITGHLSPFEKPEHSSLMTPSINKMDMPPSWSASTMTTSSFMYQQSSEYRLMHGHDPHPGKRYPPAECTTTAAVCKEYTQPYKVKDDRPYLLKHPTNCLYKPQQKW